MIAIQCLCVQHIFLTTTIQERSYCLHHTGGESRTQRGEMASRRPGPWMQGTVPPSRPVPGLVLHACTTATSSGLSTRHYQWTSFRKRKGSGKCKFCFEQKKVKQLRGFTQIGEQCSEEASEKDQKSLPSRLYLLQTFSLQLFLTLSSQFSLWGLLLGD